ncbi:MAG: hypothetical protein AAGA70_02770 [Pseudomonadota bacterium]
MNGTFLALDHQRRSDRALKLRQGRDSVLAMLLVSAAVSAGAAYVALDYVTSPFATPSVSDETPPLASIVPPAMGPQAADAAMTAAPIFQDDEPVRQITGLPLPETFSMEISERPLADNFSAAQPSSPIVDGVADLSVSPLPVPRPGTDSDSAFAEAVLAALSDAGVAGPAAGASTFGDGSPGDTGDDLSAGLVASLRPDVRPDGFAATVARARTPREADVATSVAVARAASPDVEVAPARLELDTLRPLRSAGNPCTRRLTRDIPNRPRSAAGGTAVISAMQGLGGSDRDAQIVAAALGGNVPDFLRTLRPVSFTGVTATGQEALVTICVTPDYLAIGSDRDHVRVPLGLPAALQIADRFEMMLPTTRMVDAIYAQADLRLSPLPMEPGAAMTSTAYFLRHDGLVDAQMARSGGRLGLLVAGQKKDLVLANRLSSNPGRVAIYGWHRASGNPIQPLSTVHGSQYADYSHGIRLVSRTAFVNGQAVDLGRLLTDARYASLLNSDGPITGRAEQLASLR